MMEIGQPRIAMLRGFIVIYARGNGWLATPATEMRKEEGLA